MSTALTKITRRLPRFYRGSVSAERSAQFRLRESVRQKTENYRQKAKRLGLINTLTFGEVCELLNTAEGVCCYCLNNVGVENLGIDHIVPMAKGGANSLENVTPACFPCNAKKKDSLYTTNPL